MPAGRQHGDDHIGRRNGAVAPLRRLHPGFTGLAHGAGDGIEPDHAMARLDEIGGHRPAHVAEADKGDGAHGVPYLFSIICRATISRMISLEPSRNLMHAQIAHDFLNAVIREIAITAMQLQGVVGDGKTGVRHEFLRHGAKRGGVGRLHVQRARRTPQKRPRRLQINGHVGQPELQGLELVQPFPERPPLAHIDQRLVKRLRRAAQRTGGDVEPPAIKPRHGDAKPLTLRAQPIGCGNAAILANHLPRRLRLPAHLPLIGPKRQPRRILLHHKRGHAARALVRGASDDHIKVSRPGARDELLDAIEQIKIPLSPRLHPDRGGVRPGGGFGEAIGGEQVHPAKPRPPLFALRVVAEAVDHPGRHVVNGEIGGDSWTAPREGLENQGGVKPRKPRSSNILPRVNPAHAQRGGLAENIFWEMLALVPLQRMGRNFFAREIFGHFRNGPMVVVESKKIEHDPASERSGALSPPKRGDGGGGGKSNHTNNPTRENARGHTINLYFLRQDFRLCGGDPAFPHIDCATASLVRSRTQPQNLKKGRKHCANSPISSAATTSTEPPAATPTVLSP